MKGLLLFLKIKLFLAAVTMIAGMLLVASTANAGVGMLEEAENLYVSDLSFSGGSKYWDAQHNVIDSSCKRRNASLVHRYEYCYSYFHTIFANVSFAYRKCGNINRAAAVRLGVTRLGGKASGVGDVTLGVRTRLNYNNTAAWEAVMIIPTGYDNNSPTRLGRGSFGLGLGLLFGSRKANVAINPWGWKLGTSFTYFFSGKSNTLASFATVNYALSDSNFEQTGDFLSLSLRNSLSFSSKGVLRNLFVNQASTSITNSDQTKFELGYSHSFGKGWSTSIRGGKYFFGRNSLIDYVAGWGLSYRWRD